MWLHHTEDHDQIFFTIFLRESNIWWIPLKILKFHLYYFYHIYFLNFVLFCIEESYNGMLWSSLAVVKLYFTANSEG